MYPFGGLNITLTHLRRCSNVSVNYPYAQEKVRTGDPAWTRYDLRQPIFDVHSEFKLSDYSSVCFTLDCPSLRCHDIYLGPV